MALRGRGYRLMRVGKDGARLYLPEVYTSLKDAGLAKSLLPEELRDMVFTVRVVNTEERSE